MRYCLASTTIYMKQLMRGLPHSSTTLYMKQLMRVVAFSSFSPLSELEGVTFVPPIQVLQTIVASSLSSLQVINIPAEFILAGSFFTMVISIPI